jgi:RND family efflux transporter MFP subunit
MPDTPQLRDQLRSLSIPREQRPGARPAGRRAGGGVTWLLVLVVVALGGYVAWDKLGGPALPILRPTSAPAPVRIIPVAATRPNPAVAATLTATGKIVSDHQVEVSTKVSGQIVALHFEQGDRVERGQILAEIENVLPRARRDEAQAALARARATAAYEDINYARVADLHKAQRASDIEYAGALRARDEAHASVLAAEATLAYAEKVLRDCRVEAPIAGVILTRNVEVGDFVAAEGGRGAMANSQFASIADMTKLRVEVDVNELDIARLRPDMPCVVIPDAHKDRRYRGHVLWIDPGANYAKATVQVKVRIADPDDDLRVEGAAQVQFLTAAPQSAPATSSAPSGVWIPSSACLPDPGGQTGRVFVVTDGRLVARAVTIGQRTGDSLEIVAGLTAGADIAAEGLERLRDGQPVGR